MSGGGSLPPLVSSFVSIALFFALLAIFFVNSLPSDQVYLLTSLAVLLSSTILLAWFVKADIDLSVYSAWALAVFYALVIHSVLSDWPWLSLWLGLCVGALPLGIVVGEKLFDSRCLLRVFLISVITITILNSCLAVYQTLTEHMRLGGIIRDPNLAANTMAIGAAICAYALLSGKYSVLAGLCLAWYTASIFILQSRGGWISLSFGLLALTLCYALSQQFALRRLFFFLTCLVVGYSIALLFQEQGVADSVGLGARPESLRDRFDMWRSAWQLFLEYPVIGSGLGTFALRYPAVRLTSETSSAGLFAHFDLLQLLLEIGFVGTVLIVSLPIFFLVRVARRAAAEIGAFGAPMLSLSLLVVVVAHSFVNFIIYQPFIAFVTGVFLGLGSRSCSPMSARLGLTRSVLYLPLTAYLVFMVISGLSDLKASRIMSEIQGSSSRYDLQSQKYYDLLFLELLSPLNVNIKNYILEAEVASAIGLLGTEVGDHFRADILARIEQNKRLLHPNCVQESFGSRLEWFDDKEHAIMRLESLLEQAPNCYRAYVMLAEAYLAVGRAQDAEKILERAIGRFEFGEVSPPQASLILDTLANVLREQGRSGEAILFERFVQ